MKTGVSKGEQCCIAEMQLLLKLFGKAKLTGGSVSVLNDVDDTRRFPES